MATTYLKTAKPINIKGNPVGAGSVFGIDSNDKSEIGLLLSVGCEKTDGPERIVPFGNESAPERSPRGRKRKVADLVES